MSTRKIMGTIGVTAAIVGTGIATAAPAAAGGVGDFLSPAFGTACTNHHGTRAHGSTTHGTGTGNGNLAGLSLGTPANQCGGADFVDIDSMANDVQVLRPSNQATNIESVPGVGTIGTAIRGIAR